MLSCMPFCGGKAVNKKRTPDSVWHKRLGRHWIPLENAAKIFVATYNSSDTKVYRYTVELFQPVDPNRLQSATEKALDSFDLYRATIRRGFFWYYLEETHLRPIVQKTLLFLPHPLRHLCGQIPQRRPQMQVCKMQ
jgi:hypothetical protein